MNINNELISIEEYLSDTTIKKEFKRKDIFFDILFYCVNNFLSYCEKNINYNNLLNSLSDSFLSRIRKGEISNNSKTKDIIKEFINYINSSFEYHNNIKKNLPQKFKENKFFEKFYEITSLQIIFYLILHFSFFYLPSF